MVKLLVMSLVLVTVACEPRPSQGGEIIIHTHSYHAGGDQEYERLTPGIGYQADNNWRFGVLRNSFGKPSGYLVRTFPESSRLRFGLGFISGYRQTPGGLTGDAEAIIPLIGAEYDLLKNVSLVWFGVAINLAVKFKL